MSADGCKSMGLLLGAHLDGQLDTVKTLEVEEHVASCETCRERLALDGAMRGSLKKAVKVDAPAEMRSRILASLAAEANREEARREEARESISATSTELASFASGTYGASAFDSGAEPRKRPAMLRHWRTMIPIASAAALVMAWGAASKQPILSGGASDTMVPAGLSDDLLRDIVGQHSHSLPPEQADPKQVRQFERYVGVPVNVPHFRNAQFVGGRLVPLHGGERAAMLQYEVTSNGGDARRVTVFVYDPRKIQIGGANLSPRAIGTAEVRVGQADGYSVAVTTHGGVGYAMASDLDADSSAKLVSAVDRE